MYSKKQRHIKIIDLIKSEKINRQEDIAKRLNELGYNVTQATVSRDIRDLGLVKQSINGEIRYLPSEKGASAHAKKLIEIFHNCVLSVTTAQNFVVIKTLSGAADAAASALDSEEINLILGTIAGDDTILVITKENNDAQFVCDKINSMIK